MAEHTPIAARPELPFGERIAALGAAFSGRLGFHALPLSGGEAFGLREHERFPTASCIKLGVACAVADALRLGEASLDEQLDLPPHPRVGGGGILKDLRVRALCLADLLELMIGISDNVATNVLIERVGGVEAVNRRLAGLGLERTRLLSTVDFARIGRGVDDGIGVSTPEESTRLLAWLQREEILTPELCRLVRRLLDHQRYTDQIPRWLPYNPYARDHGYEQDVWIGSKNGELDGIRADIALVRHPGGAYAVAIYTDGAADLRESVDVEGARCVAEASAAIFARLVPGAGV